MKLASLDNALPDGRLAVISNDLQRAVFADGIAGTLQMALDDWANTAPLLVALSTKLHEGLAPAAFSFDAAAACAPLPRAWQWLDGSAFTSHGLLMQKAFNMPPIESKAPLMYQGMSHKFLGGAQLVALPSETDGIDFEGEFGVITDFVPMGTKPEAALDLIRLVVLINDWSLRTLAPAEMKTGFGWVQAKPACSLAPVAVTPDELGPLWCDGRVQAPLEVNYNGKRFGRALGGAMAFGFHDLIAHAAATRDLCAGTIIGSGTVSNGNPEMVGSSCLAELRALEMISAGAPQTPFMSFGDHVFMQAYDQQGVSLFGAIDQRVTQAAV